MGNRRVRRRRWFFGASFIVLAAVLAVALLAYGREATGRSSAATNPALPENPSLTFSKGLTLLILAIRPPAQAASGFQDCRVAADELLSGR